MMEFDLSFLHIVQEHAFLIFILFGSLMLIGIGLSLVCKQRLEQRRTDRTKRTPHGF